MAMRVRFVAALSGAVAATHGHSSSSSSTARSHQPPLLWWCQRAMYSAADDGSSSGSSRRRVAVSRNRSPHAGTPQVVIDMPVPPHPPHYVPPAQRPIDDASLDYLPPDSPLRAAAAAAKAAAATTVAVDVTSTPSHRAATTHDTTPARVADDNDVVYVPTYTPRVTPLPEYYDGDVVGGGGGSDRHRARMRAASSSSSSSVLAGEWLLPRHAAVDDADDDDDYGTTAARDARRTAGEQAQAQEQQQQETHDAPSLTPEQARQRRRQRRLREMQLDMRKLEYYANTPHYATLLRALRDKYAVDEHTRRDDDDDDDSGDDDDERRRRDGHDDSSGGDGGDYAAHASARSTTHADDTTPAATTRHASPSPVHDAVDDLARTRAQLLRMLSGTATPAAHERRMTGVATPQAAAAVQPPHRFAAAAQLRDLTSADEVDALVQRRLRQLQQQQQPHRRRRHDSTLARLRRLFALSRSRATLPPPALRSDDDDGGSGGAVTRRRDVDEFVVGHRTPITSLDTDNHLLHRLFGIDAMQRRQLCRMLTDIDKHNMATTMHVLHTYPYTNILNVGLALLTIWLLVTLQMRYDAMTFYDEYLGLDLRAVPGWRTPLLVFAAVVYFNVLLVQPVQLLSIALTRAYRILMRRPIGPP